MRGNLKAIHPFQEAVWRFKITHVCKKTQTTQDTGTGDAWAVISRPKAMAVTTWTVNLHGLANLC